MGDLYFLIFGIVVSLVGIVILALKIRVWTVCRKKVDATVTGVKTETNRVRGSTLYTYYPQISYTVDGKEYKETAPFSTVNANKYNAGDTMRIYVNEKNPELLRFKGRIGLFIVGLVVLAVGQLFVILYFI